MGADSYQPTWPMTFFLHCLEPPRAPGATPPADTREVVDGIDAPVREEFAGRGWMVVRNYGDEVGLPWQEAFNLTGRDGVTRHRDVLDRSRARYRAAATRFDYRRDDVLGVDDTLASQGREPCTGPRSAAMAEDSDGPVDA
jgi:hypothetical protein